jgi:hypothetical protein
MKKVFVVTLQTETKKAWNRNTQKRRKETMGEAMAWAEVEALVRRLPVREQWQLVGHLTERLCRESIRDRADRLSVADIARRLEETPHLRARLVRMLRDIADYMLPEEKQERLSELFSKRDAGGLSAKEQAELEALVYEGQVTTVEKAEAMLLLKQLGEPLPWLEGLT